MASLKDMLEPGERIVVRFRPIWPLLLLPVPFTVLALAALTWAFYSGLLLFVTPGIFPAVILSGAALYAAWAQPVVTDRRVLWRRSVLDPVWGEIRIADITAAHFEINMVVISDQFQPCSGDWGSLAIPELSVPSRPMRYALSDESLLPPLPSASMNNVSKSPAPESASSTAKPMNN